MTDDAGLADRVEAAIARLIADPGAVPVVAELAAAAVPPVPDDMTIGRLAAFSGLSEHTLRYYEREGLVRVERGPGGQRRYDAEAIRRVLMISRLGVSGMPVSTLKELCRLLDAHGQHDPSVRELLLAHRSRLQRHIAELQLALAITDHKL